MTFRELEPAEIAVLDAIIDQRINSEGDVFEYDFQKAREYLNKTEASRKHMITPNVQREITIDLAQKRIIDMDTIVSAEFINNYRSSQDQNYMPDESMPKFFWLNNTEWAHETYQLNGAIDIEDVYSSHGGSMFIRMTTEEAKDLTDSYIANHVVRLDIDMERNCLRIKVGGTADWLYSPALQEDKPPFKILCYVLNNPNRRIDREELFKKAGIDVRGKYLRSQVFSDNGTVKILSQTQLLDLDKKWIMVREVAKLTAHKLNELKAIFKI